MAVLEKIRVKMGVFVSLLIGLSLLAFILDPDTLRSTLSMFSSKNDVGEMNGKGINYQDYQKKVEFYSDVYQMTSGGASSNSQTQKMINNTAWQNELAERVMIPAAEKAGLSIGDEEKLDMIEGKNVSPVLTNEMFFKDENGKFDRSKLAKFIQAAQQDNSGNLAKYWSFLEENMVKNLYYEKYLSLLKNSEYMPPFELARTIQENNTTYSVSFVMLPFGFAPDTTIKVSDSEIEKYYSEHKNAFRQPASRDAEYVVFKVVPSDEDDAVTEKSVNKVFDKFSATPASDMKLFLAHNSDQPFNDYYYKKGELKSTSKVLDDFAFSSREGEIMPVTKIKNFYMTAKITDIREMPDSVFLKHILLQGKDVSKADSLVNVLKHGGNFTKLAEQYSADKNTKVAEIGDLGWVTENYNIPGFESVFTASKNSPMILKSRYGTHIVEVVKATKPLKKVQMALLVRESIPSKQTYSEYYSRANSLVVASNGKLADFRNAVRKEKLDIMPVVRLLPSSREIKGYENSSEVARWIFEHKPGSVSPIITIDNKYFFVTAVTGIHKEGVASLNEIKRQISNIVSMQKKGEKLAERCKDSVKNATTIEAVAEKLGTTVNKQSDITFASLNSRQFDPKFVGAVAAASQNKLEGPVVGQVGVYFFTVTGKETGAFYTEKDAKQQQARDFANMSRYVTAVLAEEAQVKDMRYRFY
ncbi:MAG: SurA N-terminal domain-containing protein [Bacteroidales bacterium]|jgi:peptidyl-prolyl cis-trans isomerase D|nr:SurA N-terminal domain-containing protein [Bacteroidales bacterium]